MYYKPIISLMPIAATKTVHFIRHGEGYHNIGFANHDAHITEKGWQQASALRQHLIRNNIYQNVQLVLVSPLMRGLETAAGAFGVDPQQKEQHRATVLLMREQSDIKDLRSSHTALYRRPDLPFVAHELCRERLGPSPCDSRRSREESSHVFPGIDFSLILEDIDSHWKAGNVESEAAVVQRGKQFLEYIMSLPQTNIAVIAHSAFFWFTFALFGGDYAKPPREKVQGWYENCECRTLVLSDSGGNMVGDVWHFKGGHAFAEPQHALMGEMDPMQR